MLCLSRYKVQLLLPDLITITAKLIPYSKRPRQVPGLTTAYSFEPESGDKQLGSLLVVIEVLAPAREAEKVTDLIIETAGRSYYDSSIKSPSPSDRFEQAIKEVNRRLTELADSGSATWVGRISAIVAVVEQNRLHLSQTGSSEAYLYRHDLVSQVSEGLADRGSERTKFFDHIASGEIEADDKLLIATPALYHLFSHDQLQDLIRDNRPNAAIGKIQEMLGEEVSVERIAALIVEITTPDKMAMQLRPDQPSKIEIGQPSNMVSAAKMAAGPVMSKTKQTAKSVSRRGQSVWQARIRPRFRQAGLKTVQLLRQFVRGRAGYRRVAVILLVVCLASAWWLMHARSIAATSRLEKSYRAAFQTSSQGQQLFQDGDKPSARVKLLDSQKQLVQVTKSSGAKALDRKLANDKTLPQPALAGLAERNNQLLDQIDGLSRVSPTTLADLSSIKGSHIDQMELTGTKLVLIDSSAGTVYGFDLETKKLRTAKSTKIGAVQSSTVSSSGDGILILTKEPTVWLYNAENDTFTKQANSFGNWPKSQVIASYLGNVYLLDADKHQIYKHTKTLAGFSPPIDFVAKDQTDQLAGAKAMAVDGMVYVGGDNGLHRYLAGRVVESPTGLPASVSHPKLIRSTADGNLIVSLDDRTGRVGLLKFDDTRITFAKQYELKSGDKISSLVLDPKAKQFYALANNRLVKFPQNP